MIEDPELAGLFRDEAEEHLRMLERGLLHLESQPDDAAVLEEVLREAHSMKGAARMLGLADIEVLSHGMEDRLRSASKGSAPLDTSSVGPLLRSVDTLRALVAESLAQAPEAPASAAAVRLEAPAPAPAPAVRPEVPAPVPGAAAPARIQTIRVAPRRLDALMGNAGELTVTHTRVAHRLLDVDAAIAQWEEIDAQQRLDRWSMDLGTAASPDARVALQAAWERADTQLRDLGLALRRLREQLGEDAARLGSVAARIDQGVREVRMLPLSTVFDQFPRLVRDIAGTLGKQARLVIDGGDTMADKRIIEEIKDPLMHVLRNAVHHGIELPSDRLAAGKDPQGTIRLSGALSGSSIRIVVADDGRGLDAPALAAKALDFGLHTAEELAAMPERRLWSLVFASGMTTATEVTDISGRGVGMDVVRANVEQLKGRVDLESEPGRGTTFAFHLPQTLATTRVLLVRSGGQVFGIPLEAVRLTTRIARADIYQVEGHDVVTLLGEPVAAADATHLLDLPGLDDPQRPITVVLVSDAGDQFALLVGEAVGEQEVVLKPPGALLHRVRNVTGAAILSSGEICVVLNAPDLLRSMRSRPRPTGSKVSGRRLQRRRTILLAEDSATTRAQLKRILESAGYAVVAAVDGQDAWKQLATQQVDAVVSDVLMPNLSGFELTERIRASEHWADLPVILVTTLATDDDRRRGLHAGASAYITKGAFDQSALLDSVAGFIGGRRADD